MEMKTEEKETLQDIERRVPSSGRTGDKTGNSPAELLTSDGAFQWFEADFFDGNAELT